MYSVYLVCPGIGVETVLAKEIQLRSWSLEDAMEALCQRLELSEDCWTNTENSLFVYRTADYVLPVELSFSVA